MDYSLLIVVAAGMMKMATGDDFPLRQGTRIGSRLVFGGYRALRQRNLQSSLEVFLEYLVIYRTKRGCGRPPRWAEPSWACLGPQARPGGMCPPTPGYPQVLLWPILGVLVYKKSPASFAVFGLHLILISCDVKNKQKQQLAPGQ